MRILLVGEALDAHGFALAGVEAVCPEDADTARAHLARAAGAEPPIGLLLVSERIAALVPRDVERLARSERPPAVLVLPGAGA